MSPANDNNPNAMTLTGYRCRFGEVLKRHHPVACTCGCKGGRIGEPERWTVTLAGETPFYSTSTPLKYATETAANDAVAQLMRVGAGPEEPATERTTWSGLQASPDRPHVVRSDPRSGGQPSGHEARVQLSDDGRLLKVKITIGSLWRISVLDGRTLEVIAEGCGTDESTVWQDVARGLSARGWGRRPKPLDTPE